MDITVDVAALASAVLWPTIIVVVLLAYQKSIPEALKSIWPRIKSVTLGGVSVELASIEARELREPGWSGGTVDLRHAGQGASDINDSTLATFILQVGQTSHMDYAIVDLGAGANWLTSRLFILSFVLRRMRGLKIFVFVDATEDVSRRYIGIAQCDQLRWRLAQRVPEFERALASAMASIGSHARVVDDYGRLGLDSSPLSPNPAVELMRGYLSAIQQTVPPAVDPSEWVQLPRKDQVQAPQPYERARWLTKLGLEDLLRGVLDQTHIKLEDLQPLDDAGRAKAVVGHHGHFVAITGDDRAFHGLIDREMLVETAAKNAIAKSV